VKALLASGNAHKAEELAAALPGWEVELLGDDLAFPPETGETYYENARVKALHGRGLEPRAWIFGEDSGIEVAALGGRPGIESARWASNGVEALLRELAGETHRGARYVCALVAVSPEGRELHATGLLEGTIAEAPRGTEGFGYDPIFVPEGERRTVAELGNKWKRKNSHRARAAHALSRLLTAPAAVSSQQQAL